METEVLDDGVNVETSPGTAQHATLPLKGRQRKVRSLEKRIFDAQKRLDVNLQGDELLGAMRQCLHEEQLLLCIVSTNAYADPALEPSLGVEPSLGPARQVEPSLGPARQTARQMVVGVRYVLTYQDELEMEGDCSFSRADFASIDQMMQYIYASILHGLFGLKPPSLTGSESISNDRARTLAKQIGILP